MLCCDDMREEIERVWRRIRRVDEALVHALIGPFQMLEQLAKDIGHGVLEPESRAGRASGRERARKSDEITF